MATRSYSISDIEKWKFDEQNIPQEWLDHLGDITGRFHMYIDGDGGHGKTEYVLKLAKMLAIWMGKVRLNNVEQGKHVQIQQSVVRNNFKADIKPGKFQYDSIRDFDKYKIRIARPNSGRIQIIDSISYWPLRVEQVQDLINTFKHKSFVFVGYKAHAARNKAIAHLCDIKVSVKNFKAVPTSRFGGNAPFVIWDKKKSAQTELILE